MIKYSLLTFFFVTILVVALFGFRGQKTELTPIEIFPDMDRQAKVKAQKPSDFFGDRLGARAPVPGAVPLGYQVPTQPRQNTPGETVEPAGWSQLPYAFASGDSYPDTGMMGEVWGDGIPFEVTPAFLARGQERYDINCAICHGKTGDGGGVAAQYTGLQGLVATYHSDRLREMPDGQIYNTIAYGKGQMYGYAANISVADRWAIVAYVRALQTSQNVPAAELTPALRAKMEN